MPRLVMLTSERQHSRVRAHDFQFNVSKRLSCCGQLLAVAFNRRFLDGVGDKRGMTAFNDRDLFFGICSTRVNDRLVV
jgi:hypothetical protein